MPFEIEQSDKNLYKIKISDFTDEEFYNFTLNYRLIFKDLVEKIYIIFDSWNLEDITYNQIIKLSLFLQQMKPIHKKQLERFSILVSNKKIVKIIDIVFFIVPPVRPYKVMYLSNEDYLETCNSSFVYF